MLLIPCVYCGPRDETEFHYGGQAHVPYPENPNDLTDAQWAQFLFYRDNPKGLFAERWLHRTGCRQWFNVVRDTVTYEIHAAYPAGERQPDLSGFTPAPGAATTTPAGADEYPPTTNPVQGSTPKEPAR
ncbi:MULTISPECIES: sarcosine oxidase subunit delta [Microbacterium]|uniref:sarcosine oxidase subunit delta n=1 Tax=Microbacterium TaxID=33882 RepID=UPI000D64D468|nr:MULTISPECIES: sarcosine oxidase subunit delta [Microbacterium]